GDKYETGRAMGHLQKDMYAGQLAELVQMAAALNNIDAELLFTEAKAGALLRTDTIDFFISIGLGKKSINGRTTIFLSPLAPLARALQDKQAGDDLLFGRETLCIREIF